MYQYSPSAASEDAVEHAQVLEDLQSSLGASEPSGVSDDLTVEPTHMPSTRRTMFSFILQAGDSLPPLYGIPLTRNDLQIKDVRRDLDSIYVVATSLSVFAVKNQFDVNVTGLKSSPNKNKKQLRALNNFFCYNKCYVWYYFKLGNCISAGKIFVLYAVTKGAPIGQIRRNFLVDVLQQSAVGLDRHSRSDTHNISCFNPADKRRTIRVLHDDWPTLTAKMDEILEKQTFQNSNKICKLLFYSAMHGLQDTRVQQTLGETAVDLISTHLQVDINSPKILLVTVDVSVNVISRDKEALLVDCTLLKQFLKCKFIREPMTVSFYRKYNIVGLSQFT